MSMINLKTLGEIRQDNDVSQEKMAKIVGVKRSTLSKWEIGLTVPSLRNVFDYARYFNFTIDYMLGLNHDRKRAEYNEYDSQLIANNLRALRLNANLTLAKLSKQLHVSYAAIARYEHNKSNPSLNVVYRYCKTFKISFHELCTTKILLKEK